MSMCMSQQKTFMDKIQSNSRRTIASADRLRAQADYQEKMIDENIARAKRGIPGVGDRFTYIMPPLLFGKKPLLVIYNNFIAFTPGSCSAGIKSMLAEVNAPTPLLKAIEVTKNRKVYIGTTDDKTQFNSQSKMTVKKSCNLGYEFDFIPFNKGPVYKVQSGIIKTENMWQSGGTFFSKMYDELVFSGYCILSGLLHMEQYQQGLYENTQVKVMEIVGKVSNVAEFVARIALEISLAMTTPNIDAFVEQLNFFIKTTAESFNEPEIPFNIGAYRRYTPFTSRDFNKVLSQSYVCPSEHGWVLLTQHNGENRSFKDAMFNVMAGYSTENVIRLIKLTLEHSDDVRAIYNLVQQIERNLIERMSKYIGCQKELILATLSLSPGLSSEELTNTFGF